MRQYMWCKTYLVSVKHHEDFFQICDYLLSKVPLRIFLNNIIINNNIKNHTLCPYRVEEDQQLQLLLPVLVLGLLDTSDIAQVPGRWFEGHPGICNNILLRAWY